jgi:quinoprotein glucose dehydrogenase
MSELLDAHPTFLTVLLVGATALACLVWENARPLRPPTLPRMQHYFTNWLLGVWNALAIRLGLGLSVVGVAHYAEAKRLGILHLAGVEGVLSLAVSFLALDLLTWCIHRLYHASPLLWRLHRVHHSEPELDVSSGSRFHTLEVLASTGLRSVFVLALGASPLGVVLFEVSLVAASLFQHANVGLRRRTDARLRRFLVTPNMHRVHHSVQRRHMNSNFGTVFPWWDRIFRTHRTETALARLRLGLPDQPRAESLAFFDLLQLPFARTRKALSTAAVLIAGLLLLGRPATAEREPSDWPYTEGAPGGGRYSPLADIHRGNVKQLEVAWTYRHGDYREGRFPYRINKGTSFESTPLVVDGRLVFTTPYNRVIALDPETGAELWTFDPHVDLSRFFANMIINRGVAYWRDPAASGACSRRVFLATLDARLIALDAATGSPCRGFGAGGTLDLLAGLEPVVDPWEYNVTSPGTVVGDVIVVGSSIADTIRPDSPPGDVRAFDVRTGRLVWTFHTIPHRGEAGFETWEQGDARRSGGANVWSTITADLTRGWVFLPVSTATPDFHGGERLGANLFSDSVVALDAATGRRIWHFQTVHHDLWDYDLAAPPVLVHLLRDGREVDAVAQATKTGFVFVLDRDTGKPLFPVEERPVPASDVPGEVAWPTQPFPLKPPPLVPQRLDEDDLYARTPEHLEACRKQLAELRNEGLFTPPSIEGSVLYPFTGGGANWSGAGFDPARRWLYVPVSNRVHVVRLKKLAASNAEQDGGARPLRGGLRGLWFGLTGRGTGLRYFTSPLRGRALFAHDGVPCNAPPWGMLVAVDLDAGEIRWSVPTGENEEGAIGLGAYGPPLVTAGGLVFHAGTEVEALRVHDAATGDVIARFDLPAGLHAGPVSYRIGPGGKQYLVVAPGGHVIVGSKLGDYVIAFALPD